MSSSEGEASPYKPPTYVEPREPAIKDSDITAGINLHLWDNLLQAVCVAVCAVVGGIVGAQVSEVPGATSRTTGIVVGSFLGVLFGLIASGIFIMVYRSRLYDPSRRSRHLSEAIHQSQRDDMNNPTEGSHHEIR